MRSIPRRTATSIRSMGSKRIAHGASSHRKYVRLAKLAFEREYQLTHLAHAKERAKECETRLAEIDDEQAELLATIHVGEKGVPGAPGVPRRVSPSIPGRPGVRRTA